MNKLFVGVLALGLIGCGQDAVFDIKEPGPIPVTCEVLPDATLQCSDGTVRSLNGKDGATGATGQQGATGATGAQGIQGATGQSGLNGAQGAQGIQGIQGATGAQGAQGLTGATGATGNQGIAGVAGTNGQDGKDGQDGAKILYGIQDPTVSIGQDGDTFINNDTNDLFEKVDGQWVLQTNLNGADGQDGTNGTDGVDGVDGANGLNGQDGKDGADGQDGLNGTNGRDGASGVGIQSSRVVNGDLIITYTDGSVVNAGRVKGDTGATGSTGATGAAGQNGTNGINGTNGADGQDGADAVILSTTQMPVAGVCHMIAPGVWAKNEGMKADIYNNNDCSHQGDVGTYNDNGTICNNLSAFNEHREDHNGEICWVGEKIQVTIEGVFAEMVIKVLTFN